MERHPDSGAPCVHCDGKLAKERAQLHSELQAVHDELVAWHKARTTVNVSEVLPRAYSTIYRALEFV